MFYAPHFIFTFLALLICAPLAHSQDDEQAKQAFRSFLRGNAEKFPLMEMKRAEIPFATVHTLPPWKTPLEYKGKFYSGFRFTTPEWLDGSINWLLASVPGVNLKDLRCQLVPEDPIDVWPRLFSDKLTNLRFPHFRERFPGAEYFLQVVFTRDVLAPSKRYIVWFEWPTNQFPELKFSFAVNTERGLYEHGMLPTGYPALGPSRAFMKHADSKPKLPAEIVSAVVATQRISGTAAALVQLEKELSDYIDCGGEYEKFHLTVWREAQVYSGRTDAAWAASLFEWLQLKHRSLHAFVLADDLVTNTVTTLSTVYRYGAAMRAFEPFFDEMARRGVDLDPAAHPDNGPALTQLPEVRLRTFPDLPPLRISVVAANGQVSFSNVMPRSFPGAMDALAAFECRRGDWKKSFVRNFAACDWIERNRKKIGEPENYWYKNRMNIARTLSTLGLLEAADAEYDAILNKGWPDIYRNRTLIEARHRRLAIRVAFGDADRILLTELDEIYQKLRNHQLVHSNSWKAVEVTKARCLNLLGRRAQALALLTKLAEEGNYDATIQKIRLLLEKGAETPATIEAELKIILQKSRDWGHKIDEAELYSLYARFLDQTGRMGEALAMQREAVRLVRAFDLFPKLPVELARLSVLLARSGDPKGAATAADEAKRLAGNNARIPSRIAKDVATLLSPIVPLAIQKPAELKIETDLQPLRALVIPVKGRPLRGNLTLTNPSSQAVEGTLAFSGIAADASWDAAAGEAYVSLGKPGIDRLTKLRIEPGSFALIQLAALPDTIDKATLTAIWSATGQPERQSVWSFDPAEEGVDAAVIEAGEYKTNPFYGVPIYHHFMQTDTSKSNVNFRITATPAARVELYDAGDRPVAIDADGNGSYGESGDSLFSDADTDGSADLPAIDGELYFRVQVYPIGEIQAGGLSLKIENKIGGQWIEVAEDRVLP